MHQKETEYFQRQAESRMLQLNRIKSDIEVKNNLVKGRSRDYAILSKRQIPPKSMEERFREHCQCFSIFRREKRIQRFNEIMTDASNVCEELIPSISRIKSEDRKLAHKWLHLKKNYETNLDVNTENWHTDKHYKAIKEELIQMQQDKGLPDYYRFCLINSHDTMSRMNRSNQEIKDTRMLYVMSDKLGEKQVKVFLERMLKKYQRIHDNQELVKNGAGWKLVSKKQLLWRDEDQQLINAHLKDKKPVSFQTELKKKTKQFVRQLNLENQRKNFYRFDSNPIISKFQKRIFKTDQTGRSDSVIFDEQMKIAQEQIEKNEQKVQEFKSNYQQAVYMLKTQHKRNYKGKPFL